MAFPIGEGMPLAGLESTGNRREDIKKAAVQFEAFFLRQMLSEVRGSSEGGLLDQGPGAKMFKEMLDERLADSMAEGGGIGIAQMVAEQLSSQLGVEMDPEAIAELDRAPGAGAAEPASAVVAPAAAGAGGTRAGRSAYGRAPGRLSTSPIDGVKISSSFGRRTDPIHGGSRFHGGMDLAATTGTPVKSAGPGVVVRAAFAGGYGNLVVIDHGDGLQTRYAHLDAFDVDVGDRVPAGARIGSVGETGRTTGPHLHFEVRRDGKAVDPAHEIFPLK